MLRRLGLLCAMLAMFTVAGGHWTVLQTVAWAEMLHDHAQRGDSLVTTVAQTFDGQHPCALCREIRTARSREHQGNPAAPDVKKDAPMKALLADAAVCPDGRTAAKISFGRDAGAAGPCRAEPPPTPPPRQSRLTA